MGVPMGDVRAPDNRTSATIDGRQGEGAAAGAREPHCKLWHDACRRVAWRSVCNHDLEVRIILLERSVDRLSDEFSMVARHDRSRHLGIHADPSRPDRGRENVLSVLPEMRAMGPRWQRATVVHLLGGALEGWTAHVRMVTCARAPTGPRALPSHCVVPWI